MKKKGKSMPANYFYGPQAEQFAFYRIPKAQCLHPIFHVILFAFCSSYMSCVN